MHKVFNLIPIRLGRSGPCQCIRFVLGKTCKFLVGNFSKSLRVTLTCHGTLTKQRTISFVEHCIIILIDFRWLNSANCLRNNLHRRRWQTTSDQFYHQATESSRQAKTSQQVALKACKDTQCYYPLLVLFLPSTTRVYIKRSLLHSDLHNLLDAHILMKLQCNIQTYVNSTVVQKYKLKYI